ncbi:hypothetical protein AARAC_001481 [Aspergillus arachidicola]|uniref:Uncharacterized protein n=1 Tax=Aspergillus arachidicola TaxID=656916 RepID=A0A2G7FH43_9EURO|nr:hypothetical protein AARAC_001481 [Aspergillus arachidicola]
MPSMNYQVLITGEQDTKVAQKRRNIYLRPFLLFWLNSLFAEIIFLAVGVFVMTGTRDLLYKVLWTLVFCPLGWVARWEVLSTASSSTTTTAKERHISQVSSRCSYLAVATICAIISIDISVGLARPNILYGSIGAIQ